MRILLVSARPPRPVRRGDQARLSGWLRALAPRHQLSLVSLVPPGFEPVRDPRATREPQGRVQTIDHGRFAMFCGLAATLRGQPFQVAMHRSTALARAFDEELRRFRPHVVVALLSRVGWLLERAGAVPVVLDLVDSLALNLERRARRQPAAAWLLGVEARRMKVWDRQRIARAAAACVVSEDDRQALIQGAPTLAAKIFVVPFGLPIAERLEPSRAAGPARGGAPIVLLAGNLGYFPTVDAARIFATQVWPRVRSALPAARWWLAGARPARTVRRLASIAGVRVIADPPDLAAIRRQATLAIAPLHAGSGTPIKVLEAMADGLPVVTTARGAAGLDGVPEDAVAIADRPEQQVAAIVHRLRDPSAARAQAEAALRWLKQRHDLARVARDFERLLLRVARPGA